MFKKKKVSLPYLNNGIILNFSKAKHKTCLMIYIFFLVLKFSNYSHAGRLAITYSGCWS